MLAMKTHRYLIGILFFVFTLVVFLTPNARVSACSDLKDSMLPYSTTAYPKYGEWEPAKLGYYTASKASLETYTSTTAYKVIHTDNLYVTNLVKSSKTGQVIKKTYTKYKRIHWERYRYYYTKGSKRYYKDLMVKVTLSAGTNTSTKPGSSYDSWFTKTTYQ